MSTRRTDAADSLNDLVNSGQRDSASATARSRICVYVRRNPMLPPRHKARRLAHVALTIHAATGKLHHRKCV